MLSLLKIRIRQIITFILIYLARMVSPIVRDSNFWIVSERGTDARDNGYAFYRYIKEKHTDQKVYYLIDFSSSDYEKVKADAIKYGSFKSYMYIAKAEMIISSHAYLFIPNCFYKLYRFLHIRAKVVFLQHGIIKDYIPFYCYPNMKLDMFVCGARPEYDYLCNYFGYPKGVVQYTGLARMDSLHGFNVVPRQILIMPTWRQWENSNILEFRESAYFLNWQKLLNNQEFIRILDDNNTNVIFYPHYEVQKYISCFSTNSKHIKIATAEKYDVQKLLKESCLLITDFSSVYFDFAYMKKPVIYYQFDRNDFFERHYQKGYFDYFTMGFGPVCQDETNLTSQINNTVLSNYEVEIEYMKRMCGFFELHDKFNCDRIYSRICKLRGNNEYEN